MICTKDFSIEVSALAVLLRICDYGTLQPLLIPHATANPSVEPEWDGTFNVFQTCLGQPNYRFQGDVSIQGKEVKTQTDCVGPDATAPWILIYKVGANWRFELLVQGGLQSAVWIGEIVGVSPIGTYSTNGVGSDPRLTLDICAG